MTDTSTLIIAGLTFLLAGLVKGVIGLGLPTVAMGLLSIVMPPAQAASLLIAPSLITNIWQLAAGPDFMKLARRLWLMMAGIVLGTWAGAGLMTGDTADEAAIGLGLALMLYAGLGLTKMRFSIPARLEPWLSPVIGAVTGLVTAATGVFVIPAVPYLQSLGLQKDDLVQALGLSFTVSTVALALSLAREGVFEASVAGASLLALVPALAGMMLGGWVRRLVSEKAFRLCFLLGLLLLGGHFASRIFA